MKWGDGEERKQKEGERMRKAARFQEGKVSSRSPTADILPSIKSVLGQSAFFLDS